MAFPESIDPSSPLDSDSPSQGAAIFRALKQFLVDVFGLPSSPSTITAAATSIGTDGQWPVYVRLTNQSGGALAARDVVQIDTTNDKAVKLGDTSASLARFVVSQGAVANAASGLFAVSGVVVVNSTGTINRGEYVRKSGTTKVVETTSVSEGSGTQPPTGTLGLALNAAAGGVVTVLWGAGTGGGISTTGMVPLLFTSADLPDGSGSNNGPPTVVKYVSTGAQTGNSPKITQTLFDFADAVRTAISWTFLLPQDYASGGTIRLKWRATAATTNNVVWQAGQASVVDASTDARALVSDTVVTTTSACPGTLGQTASATLALTGTNMAAGRQITVWLGRDGANASDNMTDTARLLSADLEYTRA